MLLEGAIDSKSDATNNEQALDFFTRGCNLNLPTSCFYLGGLYHHLAERERAEEIRKTGIGHGRTPSERESKLRHSAVAAWIRACEMGGHELACRNAARAYRLGDAVARDDDKAAAMEKLANQATMEQ